MPRHIKSFIAFTLAVLLSAFCPLFNTGIYCAESETMLSKSDARCISSIFWGSEYQLDEAGNLYFTWSEEGTSLLNAGSSNLSIIDTDQMTFETVLSIDEASASVFIIDENIYFTKPELFHNLYIYGMGPHSWYCVDRNADDKLDRRNMRFLYKNGDKTDGFYFKTNNELYFVSEIDASEPDTMDLTVLKKAPDGDKTIWELKGINDAFGIRNYDSLVEIDSIVYYLKGDMSSIYDPRGDRHLEVPAKVLSEPIIADDMLYYVDQDCVRAYDLVNTTDSLILDAADDAHLDLCYMDGCLYVLEYYPEPTLTVISLADNSVLNVYQLPAEFGGLYSFYIYGDWLFAKDYQSANVLYYSLVDGSSGEVARR